MEILYILAAVLGVASILSQWDKCKNNGKISKVIDSGMKSWVLPIWQWAWPRPFILFSSTLLIIVLYGLVNFFHDSKSNDDKRNLIFKILVPEDADRTIYNTLIPILLGAIPAFLIWSWKNNDKRKDQADREKELKQKDRELNFHEKNYDHDKFSEYQDILEDGSNTANKRFSTTYELDYYYNKSGTYPQMVHTFLKENLKAYWEKHHTDTQVPIYIQAIYDVLDKQDKIFKSKELSLSGFHLNYYKTSHKDLSNLDLSGVVWNHANLYKAKLSNINFEDASLKEAIMVNANLEEVRFFCTDLRGAKFGRASFRKTDLQNANLVGADLSLIKYDNETDFRGFYLRDTEKFKKILEEVKDHTYNIALLKPTIFPKDFSPQQHGMQEVCEYYEENHSLPSLLK